MTDALKIHGSEEKFEPPEWKLLVVENVKPAPYNPKRRTDPSRLRILTKSLSEIGLIYPIVVDRDLLLIDGHRRLAAAKELDWKTIPSIVVHANRHEVYASVNITASKMSGNDVLCIWLQEPLAVSVSQRKRLQAMESSLGRVLCKKIAEDGGSYTLYNKAWRIGRYTKDTSPERLQRIIRWFLEVQIPSYVLVAMASGVSVRKIDQAIDQMKPLAFEVK